MATKNSKLTRAAKAAALVEDDYLLATHGLAVAGDAQTPPLRPRVGGTFPECRMSKPADKANHLTAASRLIDTAIVLEKSPRAIPVDLPKVPGSNLTQRQLIVLE